MPQVYAYCGPGGKVWLTKSWAQFMNKIRALELCLPPFGTGPGLCSACQGRARFDASG